MVRLIALVLLGAACATTAPEVRRHAMAGALAQHRFSIGLADAQALLLARTTWPGQPFGTYAVKLEAQPLGAGRVRFPVTLTTPMATGRPNDLAVIELEQDGDGVRARCTYEQSDADCADWVWSTLSTQGLEEARTNAQAAADQRVVKERRREERRVEKQAEVTARAEAEHEEGFRPSWVGSFHFGLAIGGSVGGGVAGVLLRGGFRHLHSPTLATAYLLEYQFTGSNAKPGGGWSNLVVPTFHLELAFLTHAFAKPPMAYLLVGPVGVIDTDAAPGFGAGLRGGLGLRVDWYFLEAYAQQVWTTGGTGSQFVVSGALGVGF